jgi:hypothetical protein
VGNPVVRIPLSPRPAIAVVIIIIIIIKNDNRSRDLPNTAQPRHLMDEPKQYHIIGPEIGLHL